MDNSEDSEKRWEHDLSELSDEEAKNFFEKGKRARLFSKTRN